MDALVSSVTVSQSCRVYRLAGKFLTSGALGLEHLLDNFIYASMKNIVRLEIVSLTTGPFMLQSKGVNALVFVLLQLSRPNKWRIGI